MGRGGCAGRGLNKQTLANIHTQREGTTVCKRQERAAVLKKKKVGGTLEEPKRELLDIKNTMAEIKSPVGGERYNCVAGGRCT